MSARKTNRRIHIGERSQYKLHRILRKLAFAHGRVRMRNTDRYSDLLSCRQWEQAQRVDIAMHNRPLLFAHQANQLTAVTNRMLVRRYTEDTTTQRGDFFFGNTRGILVNKEIELHFATVYVAVIVHHNSFHTTAIHFANDLRHTNRLLLDTVAGLRTVIMSTGITHPEHYPFRFPSSLNVGYVQLPLAVF